MTETLDEVMARVGSDEILTKIGNQVTAYQLETINKWFKENKNYIDIDSDKTSKNIAEMLFLEKKEFDTIVPLENWKIRIFYK